MAVPYSLNLEESLISGLFDPDETSRILAFTEIGAGKISPRFEEALKKALAQDSSMEIRSRIERLLADNAQRQQLEEALKTIELSPSGLSALLENAGEMFGEVVLKVCNRAPAPEVLDAWRTHLLDNLSGKVGDVGLHLLARFGNPSDASFALQVLSGEPTQAVFGAIELLAKQAPDLLQVKMEDIFSQGNQSAIFKSIRALCKTNSALALTFLEEYLRAPSPFVRQQALRELSLFPFEVSETAWLEFLSQEKYLLLIIICGVNVALNPHPELPLKLFDVFMVSQGEKRRLIEDILKETIHSLQLAGLLSEPMDAYLARLRQGIEEKRAAKQKALARVQPTASHVESGKAGDAPSEPAPETREQRTDSPKSTPVQTSPTVPSTPESFLAMAKPDQMALLAKLRREKTLEPHRPLIQAILSSTLSKPVHCEVINLIGTLGIKQDAELLIGLLRENDPGILVAVIRALAALSPDHLALHVNRFLQSEEPMVKVTALEFYLAADKESGLGILRSMLSSANLKMRSAALSMVPRLDAAVSEPILLSFFRGERVPDLRNQAGFLLVADLTWNGLLVIDEVRTQIGFGTELPLEDLWKTALEVAVPLLAPDLPTLQSKLALSRQKAQALQREVLRIRKTKTVEVAAAVGILDSLRALTWPLKLSLGVWILAIVIYLNSNASVPTTSNPLPPATNRVKPTATFDEPNPPPVFSPKKSGPLWKSLRQMTSKERSGMK